MSTKPPSFLIGTLLAVAVGVTGAEAGDEFSGIKRQLAAEQKEIQSAELRKLIEAERKELTEALRRLEALEARITAIDGEGEDPRQAQPEPRPAPGPRQPQHVAQGEAPKPSAERPRMRTQEDHVRDAEKVAAISSEVAGVLTPRGTLTIEPSIKYATTSSDRVFLEGFGPLVLPAFFLGIIDIRETDRKTAVASLSARYGINNRLQVSGRVPFVWRDDQTRSRPITQALFSDEVFYADGSGLGDIEVALDYQFNDGNDNWPFMTGSLRVKVPTGTNPYEVDTFNVTVDDPDNSGDCLRGDDGQCLIQSFPKELATGTGTWSIQPSLTFLYPTDPAVFYATLDYSFNLKDDFRDVGTIDPGDAFGISGGMGFGLNDRSSFSLGFSYTHGFETKNNGVRINGSDYDIGQILFGYSFRWSQDTTVNLTIGVGATDDAQDFEMTLRVPTNFVL